MRSAAATRRYKTRPRAHRCGRLPCTTSDVDEGSRAASASSFSLRESRKHAMPDLRKCAGATIALGALLSFMTHLLAQDAAAMDKAKVEAGENVYSTYCQVCHGDRLVSTGQIFDLRQLTGSDHARFDNAVRNGKNQMPPWKGVLSDEEIDQVWHYIR